MYSLGAVMVIEGKAPLFVLICEKIPRNPNTWDTNSITPRAVFLSTLSIVIQQAQYILIGLRADC